jgi:predicted metal-dependent hydrolase
MQQSIILGDIHITYTFKTSKKSRGIRVAISPLGEVRVVASHYFSKDKIDDFLRSKRLWIVCHLNKIKKNPKTVLSKNPDSDYILLKENAREIAKNRLNYFNQYYGFRWKSIMIRNQKTRWGSCSKKGSLSFNFKIALLDSDLCDYIIVHELCHLGELNHGPKFWDLVSRTVPNYVILRKRMGQLV